MKLLSVLFVALLAVGCGATQETKDLSHEILSPGGYVDQRMAVDDKIITTYRDLLEANKESVPTLKLADGREVPTQDVIDALDTILTTTPAILEGTHAVDAYTQAGTNVGDLAKDIMGDIDILSSVGSLFK